MISILYPQGDYEAADIAMKAQALSYSSTTDIYIVPKHYGRSDESVYKSLSKTKLAIFIMYENAGVDSKTELELKYLGEKKTKIYSIIPDNIPVPSSINKNTEVITYLSTDKKQATKKMNELTGKLIASQKKLSPNKDIVAGFALVMLIVLLLSTMGQPANR